MASVSIPSLPLRQSQDLTVKPLLNVVHSVFAPWLTGVAKDLVKPLFMPCLTCWIAARLRRLLWRLSARFLEAMAAQKESGVGAECFEVEALASEVRSVVLS